MEEKFFYVDLARLRDDKGNPASPGYLEHCLSRCYEFVYDRYQKPLVRATGKRFAFYRSDSPDRRPLTVDYGFKEMVRRFLAFTAWSDCTERCDGISALFEAMIAAEKRGLTEREPVVAIETMHEMTGWDA